MYLGRLWQKLGDGEVIEIATFASQHFQKHRRPLRIAIDEAIWRYKFFISDKQVEEILKRQPAARPNEKSFLWRIVQLQRLNCELVFITDGPQRPKKRGKNVHGYNDHGLWELKELLQHLGCAWHRAPGEAEAECVLLQKLGIVDAVWTEDADALMFGAHTVFRFNYTEKENGAKRKDNLKVQVYRTEDILKQYPYFTREGMVLFAVLIGADYNQRGLLNVGAEQAIQIAKNGLGELLCKASDNGTLPAWRERLERLLRAVGSKVIIPADFPAPDAVRNYDHPIVSSEETLRYLQKTWWTSTFNDATLRPILSSKYNLWIEDYIELICPVMLVRSLAQTIPGQETSNKCYQIERIGKAGKHYPGQSKIRYTVSAVTPLDIGAEYDYEYPRKPENRCHENRPSQMPQCDAILDCFLQYAVPDVMEVVKNSAVSSAKGPKANSALKKRGWPGKDASIEGSSKPAKKAKIQSALAENTLTSESALTSEEVSSKPSTIARSKIRPTD
ncbi:PIN domain-like protein [Acephala macrosclerotiorum]|nr:PIN domain-like protein [Acephala macrosclerotiorum]